MQRRALDDESEQNAIVRGFTVVHFTKWCYTVNDGWEGWDMKHVDITSAPTLHTRADDQISAI
jgi:hypothetical protein